MKNNIITIAILTILASSFLTACQSATTAGNTSATNANATKTTTNTTTENANSANNQPKLQVNKPVESDITDNSSDTPTAVYKAAYTARKNKDIKALKQLISKEMFDFFEIMGGGVDQGLKQLCESPQGASDDSRNEKIKGNKATLEYLDKNGKWKTMDFVKEDGKWKLTLDKLE